MDDERALTIADDNDRLDFYGRLAKGVVTGGYAPRGMDAAGVVVAMEWGKELGLTPIQSVNSIVVINGSPSLRGEAAIAVIRQSGLCKKWRVDVTGEGDERAAYVHTTRTDDPTEITVRFGVDDAKRAGLWGKTGPWKQYPDRMLRWRAIGYASRDVYPDAMRGARLEPEQRDLASERPEMRDVTPSEPRPEAAATVLDAIGVSTGPSQEPEPPAPQPHPPNSAEGETPFQGEPEVDPVSGERVPTQEELDRQYADDEMQAAFDEFADGFKK